MFEVEFKGGIVQALRQKSKPGFIEVETRKVGQFPPIAAGHLFNAEVQSVIRFSPVYVKESNGTPPLWPRGFQVDQPWRSVIVVVPYQRWRDLVCQLWNLAPFLIDCCHALDDPALAQIGDAEIQEFAVSGVKHPAKQQVKKLPPRQLVIPERANPYIQSDRRLLDFEV